MAKVGYMLHTQSHDNPSINMEENFKKAKHFGVSDGHNLILRC